MSSARQLHNDAMKSLQLAEEISASLEPSMALYKQSLRKALELETRAAMLLRNKLNAEPTRSVLFRSAASIAVSCGEYRQAENLVVQALYGNPPQEIKDELLGLFRNVFFKPDILPAKESITKRAFDLFFSALVLFTLGPYFLLIAILIKLDSPGPVFFKQLRMGRHNKPFYCYSFRTIRLKDEPGAKSHTVTRLGVFLRKTGMDALPQFINVIKGEMTVVGPTPARVNSHSYDSTHSISHDGLSIRYSAKPGLTGLTQVPGAKNESKSYAQYVKGWSLLQDIKISLTYLGGIFRGLLNTHLLLSSKTD